MKWYSNDETEYISPDLLVKKIDKISRNNIKNNIVTTLSGALILALAFMVVILWLQNNDLKDRIAKLESDSGKVETIVENPDNEKQNVAEITNTGDNVSQSELKRLSGRIDSLANEMRQLEAKIDDVEEYVGSVDKAISSVSKMFQKKVMPDDVYIKNGEGVLQEGVIKTDGNITQEYFDKVCDYYMQVPENVRSAFERDGWEIIITSQDIKDDAIKHAKIAAVTIHSEQRIYMSVWDAPSITHEMGHYLDGKLGFISDEFPAKAYGQELGTFMDIDSRSHRHNYSTTSEYFAETFSFYVLHHDLLKKYCPMTFEFVDEQVNKV